MEKTPKKIWRKTAILGITTALCFGITLSAVLAVRSKEKFNESEVEPVLQNTAFTEWEGETESAKTLEETYTENLRLSGGVDYTPLTVNNDEPYLNENFLGFNGVYMLFTHMAHPIYGHKYTDEQADLELDRIRDMGIKIVRTTYSSGMVYNRSDGAWHWEDSPYLNAFIKTGKELKERDIDVAFTLTWSMANFTGTTFEYSFADGYFPAGITSSGWGSTYQGTAGQTEAEIEAIRIQQNVAGYKNFLKNSITKFRAEGLTNFKYIFGFTECNNAYKVNGARDYDKICEVFDIAMTATHEALTEMNLRSEYTTVGPCDNWGGDFNEFDPNKYSRLVKYTLENLSDEVDIIGSHNGYDRAANFTVDDFYSRPNRVLGGTMQSANAAGKEFWIDEFNVATRINYKQDEKRDVYNSPYAGVAFGAMVNGIMNMGGVSNVFIWMLVEQQWPNEQDGGEFDDGIQIGAGYMPNLFESSRPKTAWYSYAMLQKYISGGKLIKCGDGADIETQSGYYYSCIERDDGEITFIVTNYQNVNLPIEIIFKEQLSNETFYRHEYTLTNAKRNTSATIPAATAVGQNVCDGLYDTLQPYSVTVYTTVAD